MIYFIQAGSFGPIKIGFTGSEDANKRIRQLQTAHPEKLECLLTIDGSYKDEQRLHEYFKHLRLQGEWFEPKPELVEFIASKQNMVTVDREYLRWLENQAFKNRPTGKVIRQIVTRKADDGTYIHETHYFNPEHPMDVVTSKGMTVGAV